MKLRHMLGFCAAGGRCARVWQAVTLRKNQPPEVRFARVVRETITSSVPTNGKVEPLEWAVARAERAGAVKKS